jgi:hypothetical protein
VHHLLSFFRVNQPQFSPLYTLSSSEHTSGQLPGTGVATTVDEDVYEADTLPLEPEEGHSVGKFVRQPAASQSLAVPAS